MKHFRIYPEALGEIDSAAAYYKEKAEGLEQKILDEFEDALTQIRRRPLMYRIVMNGVRKVRLRHFPYGVVYRLRDDIVEVIALVHVRKEPGYWKQRAAE